MSAATTAAGVAAAPTLVLVAGGAFLADQVTKAMVAASIPLNAAVAVDPHGWVILRHVVNCGGAGGLVPRLPLALYLAVLATTVVVIPNLPSPLGGALMVGGALGNIVSLAVTSGPAGLRLPSGLAGVPRNCVIDFLQVGAPALGVVPGLGAGIMNVADVAVAAGAILLVAWRIGLTDEDVLRTPAWGLVLLISAVALVEGMAVLLHTLRLALMGH